MLRIAAFVAPSTFARLGTLGGIKSLFGSHPDAPEADPATRGRLTEMLAAGLVARDHPIVGVGPGHFTPYYSLEYMANPEIAFRDINKSRRAHSLYLEMAAETGVSVNTLLSRKRYAVLHLRERLRSIYEEFMRGG